MIDNLGNKLFEELKNQNKIISSVESFTGGQFISKITKNPGASNVCKGGMVTYSNSSKITLLGIDKKEIEKFGVVSEEIAFQMALNGRKIFNSDINVSFTGNAGPGVLENKPRGLFFIGFSTKEKTIVKRYYCNELKRDELILFAINEANKIIINYLKKG